mgnify:CR=1 FL=1
MTFTTDISLDIRKNGDFTKQKKEVQTKAYSLNCFRCYGNHEFGGINRTITRNHYVMTLWFEEEKDLVYFIKFIKDESNFQIEMVGYDDCLFKLIYASRKYITFMEHEMVKKYIENKKNEKKGKFKDILEEIQK